MTPFSEEPHDGEPYGEVSRTGFALPSLPLLWRGLGLAGVSLVLGRLASGSLRTSVLLLPIALLLAGGAALAGWASVIKLTGGVRHDDHPWI